MALKIRLSRAGRTNRPYWRIVAMDSRKKRDGAYLDKLGTYDPIQHTIVTLNAAGIQEWVAKGAQCTPTVAKLVKKYADKAGNVVQSAVEEAPKAEKVRSRSPRASKKATDVSADAS